MNATPDHDEKFRSLCAEVSKEMDRLPIPGAVLGILYEDKEWIAGFGVTSVEHPLPVNEDTLFQVGSITKTFTATAIMRLVEMGKLELDQPVRQVLPGLKLADESVAARVTLRHLLTHTGGWVGDYFNDFGPGEDALSRMTAAMADLEQLTPLGEVWSYNNAGFYLAGRVIEVVTGSNYEQALRDLVLDPLELKNTWFFAEDVITHRFAVGHEVVDRQPKVARPWAIGRAAHPVGGIVCTARDLFRYARFHMGDGTNGAGVRLLTPHSLAQMQTPLFPSSGPNYIGLSWSITPLDGTQWIGHGGGTNGQITLLRIVPSRNFASVVFTNSDEGDMLTYRIANLATKEYLGLSLPEALPLELPEAQLSQYTGKYEAASDLLEITLHDGGLVLHDTPKGGFPTPDCPPPQAPPPVRIALYAADRFLALDEPMKDARGEFLRDAASRIVWMRFGGRVHKRLNET
jgi:CubicO group peptidase (beta-lactamase class C family)